MELNNLLTLVGPAAIITIKVLAFISGFVLYAMGIHGFIAKMGFDTQIRMPLGFYFIFFMSIVFSWTYIGIQIIWPGVIK